MFVSIERLVSFDTITSASFHKLSVDGIISSYKVKVSTSLPRDAASYFVTFFSVSVLGLVMVAYNF